MTDRGTLSSCSSLRFKLRCQSSRERHLHPAALRHAVAFTIDTLPLSVKQLPRRSSSRDSVSKDSKIFARSCATTSPMPQWAMSRRKTRDTKDRFKEWNCTNSDWIDIHIQDHIGYVTKLLECLGQIMCTPARNTIKTESKLKECQRMLLCHRLRPCLNTLITQIAMPDVQRKFDQLQTSKTFCQHAAQSWTTMISKANTQVP